MEKEKIIKKFECNTCHKIFHRKQHLETHTNKKNTCKKDNENIINTADKNLELQIELLKIKLEAGKLSNNIVNNITIINNNNIFININNFNDNKYQFDNDEYQIDDWRSKSIFDNGKKSAIELIKYFQFNEDLPKFHNCYIENLEDNECYIYKDNKWIKSDIKNIIQTMLIKICKFLFHKYGKIKNRLENNVEKKFKEFCDYIKGNENDVEHENAIKLLFFENKDIVKQTMENNTNFNNNNEQIININNEEKEVKENEIKNPLLNKKNIGKKVTVQKNKSISKNKSNIISEEQKAINQKIIDSIYCKDASEDSIVSNNAVEEKGNQENINEPQNLMTNKQNEKKMAFPNKKDTNKNTKLILKKKSNKKHSKLNDKKTEKYIETNNNNNNNNSEIKKFTKSRKQLDSSDDNNQETINHNYQPKKINKQLESSDDNQENEHEVISHNYQQEKINKPLESSDNNQEQLLHQKTQNIKLNKIQIKNTNEDKNAFIDTSSEVEPENNNYNNNNNKKPNNNKKTNNKLKSTPVPSCNQKKENELLQKKKLDIIDYIEYLIEEFKRPIPKITINSYGISDKAIMIKMMHKDMNDTIKGIARGENCDVDYLCSQYGKDVSYFVKKLHYLRDNIDQFVK
jgi:hypothetical protein